MANKKRKKRSGCKWKNTTRNGKPCITAWKYDAQKKGIISVLVAPYKKTKRRKSKAGITWENWIATITMPSGNKLVRSCMVNMDNKKFYLQELNMMGNPRANNGGYFGTHIRRNYR